MYDFLVGKDKYQIAGEYDKARTEGKQAKADAAYDYYYNKALYDANKDYFSKMGVQDPGASYRDENGFKTNALSQTMGAYNKYLSELDKEAEKSARQNKYNIFGSGFIGNLLNPIHQVGTAAQDFATSGTKEWENGNRDWLSDLGALGETAVTVGGGLAGLGKSAATTGAKTIGKTVAKSTLAGGAYGLAGGLQNMGTKDFNLGQLLANTGISAVLGGAFGAAGYGLGKIGNKLSDVAKSNRSVTTNMTSPVYDDMGNQIAANGVSYQDALKAAGLDPITNPVDYQRVSNILSGKNLSQDVANNQQLQADIARKLDTFVTTLGGDKSTALTVPGSQNYGTEAITDAVNRFKTITPKTEVVPVTTYTDALAKSKGGQVLQGLGDLAKNLGGTTKKVASKASNAKATQIARNLLKTKKGKVAAGAGGGLLLAQLLGNRGSNQNANQMTDEEIYNYVYGGQQ